MALDLTANLRRSTLPIFWKPRRARRMLALRANLDWRTEPLADYPDAVAEAFGPEPELLLMVGMEMALWRTTDHRLAHRLIEENIVWIDDPFVRATALGLLGRSLLFHSGDSARAMECLEEGISEARAAGSGDSGTRRPRGFPAGTGPAEPLRFCLGLLGAAAASEGCLERSLEAFRELSERFATSAARRVDRSEVVAAAELMLHHPANAREGRGFLRRHLDTPGARPDDDVAHGAVLCDVSHDATAAEHYLTRAHESDPRYKLAAIKLAILRLNLGRFDEAEPLLRETHARHPFDQAAAANLMWFEANVSGDPAAAARVAPRWGVLLGIDVMLAGHHLRHHGDAQPAAEIVSRVLSSAMGRTARAETDDPSVLARAGILAAAIGDSPGAVHADETLGAVADWMPTAPAELEMEFLHALVHGPSTHGIRPGVTALLHNNWSSADAEADLAVANSSMFGWSSPADVPDFGCPTPPQARSATRDESR